MTFPQQPGSGGQEAGRPRARWMRWLAAVLGAMALAVLLAVRFAPTTATGLVQGADVRRLAAELASNDPRVRSLAEQEVQRLGTNAIPALLEMATLPDPWTRAVCDKLSPTLPAGVRQWLREHLHTHDALLDRQRAVFVLRHLQDTNAVAPVWGTLLRGPDPGIANLAWTWLQSAGPVGLESWRDGLRDANPRVRALAAGGLFSLGPGAGPALPELRGALNDADPTVRLNAFAALANLGSAAWPDLVKVAESRADGLRLRAIRTIAQTPAAARSNAAHVLAWSLDPDPATRREALEGARWIREWAPSMQAQLAAACGATDAELRLSAFRVIAISRGLGADLQPAVEQGLGDPEPRVRQAATNALARLGATAARS